MKNKVLVMISLLVFGFALAQDMTANTLIRDFARATTTGDTEAVANLVTDDFLLTEADGTVHKGKDGARVWAEARAALHSHVEVGNIRSQGDFITLDFSAANDFFRQLDLGALEGTAEVVLDNGKLKTFTITLDPLDDFRLGAAVAEVNKTIVKQFYDAVNAKNVDAFDGFVAADFVDHNPFPEQAPGLAGLKDAIQGFILAFPDLRVMQNAEVAAMGDKVYVNHIFTGTQGGDFVGIPATNKAIQAHAIDIWTVQNGMITEGTHVEEIFQILAQLGAFDE